MGSQNRRFSDKDVARILKHAEQLRNSEGDHGDGLTEDDLTRIGQEMGLESRYVQAAIDALEDNDSDAAQVRWLGAPPSYTLDRVTDGVLTDDAWDAIVHEMNTKFGQNVQPDARGSVRTWYWKHDMGHVRLDANQMQDAVRFRLSAHIDDGLAVGMVISVVAMVFGTAGMFAIDAFRPWLSILFSILIVLTIGGYYKHAAKSWYRRDRRKMSKVLDEAVRLMRDTSSVPAPHLSTATEPIQQRLEQST